MDAECYQIAAIVSAVIILILVLIVYWLGISNSELTIENKELIRRNLELEHEVHNGNT